MKIGKVSPTVLKRSMIKNLQFHREEAIFSPTAEEMCYGVSCREGENIILSDACLYGNEKDLGVFALAQVMNDIASRGGKMIGASVHIMLPPYAYESRLKAMTELVARAGSAHAVQILCAKAEVSPAISQAIVHMNGVGVVTKEKLLQSADAKPDQDIVLLKWIGLEGTFRVMRRKEEVLASRFVPSFLNRVRELEKELFSAEAMEISREYGVSAMHQITGGGILAALWDMADAAGVGLEVDLHKMSIRQETVEICEYCHLNPYQLSSIGSVLIVAKNGEELVQRYTERGICASLIGRTTNAKERVITGGEEKRFLDKPGADELLKLDNEEN